MLHNGVLGLWANSSSQYAGYLGYNETTGTLRFDTSPTAGNAGTTFTGSTLLTILQNGNVGIGTTSPNSTLHVAGPITSATATKTAAYTLTGSDSVIYADATAGAVVVTLPAASASTIGRVYYIYKIDSTANAVSVAGAGADTVNGTASTTTQWKTKVIGYTATGWISVVISLKWC